MKSMNVQNSRYAEWLEKFIESVMEYKPTMIGVCCLMETGESMTGYFGDVGHADKAVMAHHLQTDAMMDVMKANAAELIAAAEDCEEEDNADGLEA